MCAQQQLNSRLSLYLSFLAVGPPPPNTPAEVPLIETATVVLSDVAKTWPRNPSLSGSHPKG